MAFTISFITLVFIFIVQLVLPYFVKRTVVFGVSIPEQYIKEEQLKSFKRQYVIVSVIISILMIGGFIAWVKNANPADELLIIVSTIIQFVFIFISFAIYFYFHNKTKKFKNEKGWTEELKEVAVADLTIRSADEMPSWNIYLVPFLVVIGIIIYTLFQYDALPNKIPTHWGADGKPDAYSEKSYFTVIQLLLILIVMQVMFLAFHIAIKNTGIKLSATNVNASKKRQLTIRKYTAWFLYYTVLLMTVLFALIHFQMLYPNLLNDRAMMFLPIGFLIATLAGTIVLLVKVGLSDKDSDVLVTDPIMDKDEDKYWKGGLFYFNRNDPSIFVEQRFGVGWTINLANPKAYLLLFGPIVLILIIAFI